MKPEPVTAPRSTAPLPRAGFRVAIIAFVVAAIAVVGYLNSFRGPFVFDDLESIVANSTLRHLSSALFPPTGSGMTVAGRPIVNLSLALDFSAGQFDVRWYHLTNLAIHVANALLIFGLVWRTLSRPPFPARVQRAAVTLGLFAAAWWAAHPLPTAAVTYVIQRAEALVALFYLLTLYSFVRSIESKPPNRWKLAAVGACLFGMATKEVMVSAPLLVLAYDRTFVSGSFRSALRERRGMYVSMAATWVLLAALVVSTANRGGSAGFGTAISPLAYAATQLGAIGHYVRLAFWPNPLVFDYGTHVAGSLGEIAPGAVVVGALIAGTIWAFRRFPPLGFLGVLFFAVLAPSSSIVPIATQTIAEHRMYLPLAAVLAAATAAIYAMLGRAGLVAGVAVVCALVALTTRRNEDYRTALSIWSDSAAKLPSNGRAHVGVGVALTDLGKPRPALAEFETALRIDPNDPTAHTNYGRALDELGRHEEAIEHYERSLALRPDHIATLNNLGNSLAATGRLAEARAKLEQITRGAPTDAAAHANLANVLVQLGRRAAPPDRSALESAIAEYETSLRLDPTQPKTHVNLGVALEQLGRTDEAIQQYQSALGLDPNSADAHNNLGSVLAAQGKLGSAETQLEQAIQANPRSAQAHFNLGNLLLQRGQLSRAIDEFRATVEIQPAYRDAYFNLGTALSQAGRGTEALTAFEKAAAVAPNDPDPHNNLGIAYAEAGRLDDAIREFETSLRLSPNQTDARRNLAVAQQAKSRLGSK